MTLIKTRARGLKLDDTFAFTGTVSGAGGGKINQVITDEESTEHSTNSSTIAATNYTLNITPTATTSKVLILWDAPFRRNNSNASTGCELRLYKNGSSHKIIDNYFTLTLPDKIMNRANFIYLDSPSTTSQVTYAIYWKLYGAAESGGFIMNDTDSIGSLTAMEVLA